MHEHDSTNLPLHPRTGLRAVYVNPRTGRAYWPVLGGADDGSEGENGNGDGHQQAGSSWTPPASQDDLNRIIEQRLARERAKFADYDDLKAKAEKHDALEMELSSEAEKAARKAREEAAAATRAELQPQFVLAKLEAHAARAGVADEDLTKALRYVDPSKFVTDDGTPDSEAMKDFVGAIKPSKQDDDHRGPGRFPSFGQGARPASKQTQREIGRAAAERRFGTTANK
jgi:hypothetical protein